MEQGQQKPPSGLGGSGDGAVCPIAVRFFVGFWWHQSTKLPRGFTGFSVRNDPKPSGRLGQGLMCVRTQNWELVL